jgi:hypothetical protein
MAPGAPPQTAVTPGSTPVAVDAAFMTLAEQAADHYERAIAAQREGNWALYGEEMKKLGEVLAQLEKIKR